MLSKYRKAIGHTRVHSTRTFLVSTLAMAVASASMAQEEANGPVEEVIITGSFIKGTPENNASPVEVLDSTFIENSGALTVGELTQKLSISSGAENNPDSFTAGETQGTSNVNLRGLGLTSTLVLINGKRQTLAAAAANDGSVFVDTNTVPMAALERVEILKEGATATYGSDAVAGVVNFILRKDFEGFEISGGYQTTASDSQDTQDINFLGGFSLGERTNMLVAGTVMQQDPLSSADRPYTTINAASTLGRSFLTFGPDTVASGPYAGTYAPFSTVPDAACASTPGAVPGPGFVPEGGFGPGTGGGSRCGFLYGPRFNLVNDEEQQQLYTNITHDFDGGTTMNLELGWTHHEVKDNPQSPSYPNLAFPTILPGQAGSPFSVPVRWYGRPLGAEAPSPLAPRESDTIRASVDLSGSFKNGWDWYGALTYSMNDREVYQPDTIKSRLEAGLSGVGGPNGNETFNVFDPTANSQALIDYISVDTYTNRKTELLAGDLVFSGDLMELSAGSVGLAVGMQFREEDYTVDRNEIYTQTVDPETGFATPVDLIFLGGGVPVDASKSTYAAFAETKIPLTDTIEVDLAVRYEELENDSSLDPKIAVRWQASDLVTLRASASSAFREPSLQQYYSQETNLEGLVDPLNPGGAVFVRVDTVGTTELQPEESTNLNFGVIFEPTDDFSVRVDYWRFDYEDVIVSESAQGKLNADPLSEDIQRLTPGGQLQGVLVNYINAETVNTDGIDVSLDWAIPTNSGQFGVSVMATHFLSYEIPCSGPNERGCTGASGTQDLVGYFNYDNFVRSIPDTKINTTFDWTMGNHKLALVGYYTAGYETTRAITPTAEALGFSQDIDSWFTLDMQYNYTFNFGDASAILTLGSKNITDEEAPRAWDGVNFSYDPKHHDPRGQLWYGRVKLAF